MPNPEMRLKQGMALAKWANGIKPSIIQDMLSQASGDSMLSFALGIPALELFPTEALAQAATSVLADPHALEYGEPFEPLKAHIVSLMARRGVACKPEQVFLTAGAQQGMHLIAQLLLESGGQILTEEMVYPGFQQVVEPFQPQVLTVPTDLETGMDVDAVEYLLSNGARPAFIYTVTDGHNPLSVSMSGEKRARLAGLARQHHTPIIEDDAYGFLYYDTMPLPPIRALENDWVFYLGSFSKILAPALRAGWIIAPESLMTELSIVKEASDINTSTLVQHIISAYMDEGHLTVHLDDLRREYKTRRDAMLGAIRDCFPLGSLWKKPNSGLFIWVELPERTITAMLLTTALESEKVAFIPGVSFCIAGGRHAINCMRLNFSNCAPAQMKEGISRLGRVLGHS